MAAGLLIRTSGQGISPTRQRLINRALRSKATCHGVTRDAQRARHVDGALNSAVDFGIDVAARVSRLLGVCRPAAIVWTVGTAVVPPVQRSICRPHTHVGEEVLKRIDPLITHGDAAPAVSRVGRVVRVGAALFRGCPTVVRRARMTNWGMVVPPAPDRSAFTCEATARSGVTRSKRTQANSNRSAAGTAAFDSTEDRSCAPIGPEHAAWFGHRGNDQTPIDGTDGILPSHRRIIR